MPDTLKIETDRLILRDYVESDWERVHIYGANPDVTIYEAWGPNSEAETKDFIRRAILSRKNDPRFQYEFALVEKESGLLIGGCGLRREFPGASVADMGYVVNPDFQGKGFATEAAKTVIDFGLNRLDLKVIWAICDVKNMASQRVLEKSGMKRVGLWVNHLEMKGRMRDSFRYEAIAP